MRDAISNWQVKRVISPVSTADNTATVGQAIDGLGFDSVSYIIATGSLADADATFTPLLEESADNSSWSAVADADMVSQTSGTAPETAAAFQFDDDNEVRKIGYIGTKRYTRLTITPANNASAGLWSAVAILSRASRVPITQAAA